MIRILLLCAAGYLALVMGCAFSQRKLLYFPTHKQGDNGLTEWRLGDQLLGYARLVPSPGAVWLFLHGNGGQATDRVYALPAFSGQDSVYILEYPGYGTRAGSPSMTSLNEAARTAYEQLTAQFPDTPVCVASESIGSGPAAMLARQQKPPAKIVLIVPFDTLANVAAGHYPFLPVRLLLQDNWDNVAALRDYRGQLEIIGARADTIIPVAHARALADKLPAARFLEIEGGHNDWAAGSRVKIRYLRSSGDR